MLVSFHMGTASVQVMITSCMYQMDEQQRPSIVFANVYIIVNFVLFSAAVLNVIDLP